MDQSSVATATKVKKQGTLKILTLRLLILLAVIKQIISMFTKWLFA